MEKEKLKVTQFYAQAGINYRTMTFCHYTVNILNHFSQLNYSIRWIHYP